MTHRGIGKARRYVKREAAGARALRDARIAAHGCGAGWIRPR